MTLLLVATAAACGVLVVVDVQLVLWAARYVRCRAAHPDGPRRDCYIETAPAWWPVPRHPH